MDGDGKGSTSGNQGSGQRPAIVAERLEHLLNSLNSLREERRFLLESIRATLDELKSLRTSIEIRRTQEGGAGGDHRGQPLALLLQQHHNLTRRESEVAILLAQGASNIDIASILGISQHTARHHTQAVLTKLGARSRSEAGAKIRG